MNGRSSECSANESDDGTFAIEAEDTHLRRRLEIHGLGGDRDIGFLITMRIEQFFIVHPIEMVAGQDQIVFRLVLKEVPGGLTDGVGRALIPVGIVRRLFGGENFDEAAGETVEAIGVRDVPVE
jgi:hypothetical protein